MPKNKPERNPNAMIRLGERDLKILRFVARYRLVPLDILWKNFFPGQGRDAAKSTLRRLLGKAPTHRYLRPQFLDGTRVAYRLTRRGCHELGVSQRLARPLGPRAKVERLAVLAFLHATSRPCKPLIGQKLREFLELDQAERLPKATFYLESSDTQTVFGVLFIDCGGHPRGIATRTARKLTRYLDGHWFDDEIRAKCFVVTILTGRKSKVASLKRHASTSIDKDLSWATRPLIGDECPSDFLRVQVIHVPEIENLLPGRNDRTRPSKG
jgi:hypothetical protein